MTCTTDYCGTGGNNIPKPGDPSNNGVLSATPAYGGIDINWTFPTTNPFAVAYTTIYRARTSDFNTAILLAPQVGGGFYYDKVDPGVEYFYWITFVSINGTVGEVIGPVSAVAMSSIDKTIQDLTGKIDNGVLAQSLKAEIARISENAVAIIDEAKERVDSQWELALQILGQQEITDETVTKVFQETKERKEADTAMVTSINLLYAQAGGNAAAILEEATVRANADEALGQRITSVLAKVDENSAAIVTEQTARADADGALGRSIETVSAATAKNAAAVQTESEARANADGALGRRIDTVSATAEGAVAATRDETVARIEADKVLAQRITTTETTLGKDIAQVQTNMEAKIDTVDGKVVKIGALYTAKVNVNGLIGGFGIYNDGTEVEAGFDVDRFWIGRTGANKKKPFIIQDDKVYIDQAVIYSLTFTKLRAEDGSVIVENGKLKAQYIDADNITARKIDITSINNQGAKTTIVGGLTQVFYPNGNLCLRLGVWE